MIEVPGLPQPPKRRPMRRMLKQGWVKNIVVNNSRPKKYGPKLPKGFVRSRVLTPRAKRRAMLKGGWQKPVIVKGARVKAVRPARQKKQRAPKKTRAPRKPRIKKARSSTRSRKGRSSSGSYLSPTKSIRWGTVWGLLRKFTGAFKDKSPGDGRNHGYKGSGYQGRTGFAGMKPKGRLW